MRKLLIILLVLIVVGGLAWGHLQFHYSPRLRPATPQADSHAARLLESDAFPYAVWVPYPHQTLGFLEKTTALTLGETDARALVEAAARLAGMPEPEMPAFGTLRLPPSSEIAFAADPDEDRFAIVAHVFPAMASFARLSGNLAGNPWLEGGDLMYKGRRVEVAWDGDVWMVGSPSLPEFADPSAVVPGDGSLLVARARQAEPPLQPGRFRLANENGALRIRSDEPVAAGLEWSRLESSNLFLLIAGREGTEAASQALLFFSQDDDVAISHEGTSYELPGMSVIHAGGSERWKMPGEQLLRLTGRRPETARSGSWNVAALDDDSMARVQPLVQPVTQMLTPQENGGANLDWGLWLNLDAGLDEIRLISLAINNLPLVSERVQQRWKDTETVLSATAGRFSVLTIAVTEEPAAFDLRLEP